MQFIDTNIILRYLVNEYPKKTQACYALFKKTREQKIILTTSEAVIAETVFILASKKHYDLTPEEIKNRLSPLLTIQGLQVDYRRTLIKALELYGLYKFDFEDCLSLAHMERQQVKEIYSYDQDFDQVPEIERIEP